MARKRKSKIRNGMLFINSVSMNLPFDKAPKFVQNSLAAACAAGSLSNKAAAGTPQNSEEEKSMEIKTVDDLRKAYPELVDQIEQAAEQKKRKRGTPADSGH